jgi:RNA polymerase sigma-70 factor, ECF subfamily
VVAFENLCAPVARATALRDCPVPGLDLLTFCLDERLRHGCPDTGEVVAGLLFDPLIGQLSIEFSELDRPLIADAAKEALAVSVAKPARFNPARCTLPDFLRKEARNHLRKLRRLQTDAGKSEAKWIEQAQNGDEQAFTVLACAAKPALRKEALRLIQGKCMSESEAEAEAEDLVQETLLAGWHNLADFRGDSGFATWLAGILKNKAIAWWRKKQQRSAVRLEEVSGDDGGMAAAAFSVPSLAGREHDLREFWAAIEQCLRPRDFRLLRQHFLDGKELNEIAATERLPLGTVKSLISEAKTKLRAAKRIESFRGWTLDF